MERHTRPGERAEESSQPVGTATGNPEDVLALGDEIYRLFQEWSHDYDRNLELVPVLIDHFALLQALLAELPTIAHLVTRYQVPLVDLLDLLRGHRFRWRFANPYRLFEGRTKRDIPELPSLWRDAARTLHDAAGTLLQRLGGDEGERELLRDILTALRVLDLAATTVERLPFREARDERGELILRRGRRRTLAWEAHAARDICAFLKRHTGHHLYDYAGVLLRATFPSLQNWREPQTRLRRRGETRLRDRVKQLIGARTPRRKGA